MVARLTLIRHGRSAYAHGGGWLDAAGVAQYCAGYDAAGIVADEDPPSSARLLVDEADALVASALSRKHRHTAAVTHGGFRRLLTAHLMHRGWRQTSRRSYANWSAWCLEL